MKEKPKSALVLNGLEDETFAEYILTDEAGETSAEGAVALMRKLKSLELSVSANQCNSAEAVLFEKQGALLSEYEDSYLRAEPFISPNPTYQALSLNQMRTYASWRTGCKQGIYRDVPDAYVRLYVKEVISLIGMPDRDEAMIELSWLLERVPESKWELRKSIKDSVKLLYIFGDFSGTYFDVLKDSGLFEHFPWLEFGGNEICSSLIQASSRDPYDSEYVRGNLEQFKEAFAASIESLEKLFNRYSLSVQDLLDVKLDRDRWVLGGGPIYKRGGDRTARISDNESYKFKDGIWTCTKVGASQFEASVISYICQCVEVGLAKANGDKSKVAPTISLPMDWEGVSAKRHAIGCVLRDELFKPVIRQASAGLNAPEFRPLPGPIVSAREIGITLHVQSSPQKIFALASLALKKLEGKAANSYNPGELPMVPIFHAMTNSQVRCYANWKAGYVAGFGDSKAGSFIEPFVRLRAFELICEPTTDSLTVLSQMSDLLNYTRDNGDGLYVTTQLARWIKDYYISRSCPVEFDIFINQTGVEWCFPSIAVSSSSSEDWFKIYENILNYKPKRELGIVAECFNEAIREIEMAFSSIGISFRGLFAEKQKNGATARVLFREAVRPDPKPVAPRISLGPLDTYARNGDSWLCESESVLRLQSLAILEYIIQRVDCDLDKSTPPGSLVLHMECIDGAYNAETCAKALGLLRSKVFEDAIDRAVTRITGSHAAVAAAAAVAVPEEPEPAKFHTDYVFEEDEYPDDPLEKPFDSLWGYVDMPRKAEAAKPAAKPKKAAAKKPVVTVDLAKLEEARREAAENTESLKIANEEEEAVPEPVKKANAAPVLDSGWAGFSTGLTDDWASALEIIVSGGPKKNLIEVASRSGVMLEVMIESINDLALECTGDVIMESEGGKVVVFDEYAEDVKKAIKARKKKKK